MLQYQSRDGAIRDDEGRPYLEQETLTEVLTFYQEAELVEMMPYWLTQYQDDEQVWTTFEEGRADMVVTWMSNYFLSEEEGIAMAAVPTSDGAPFTLARGWVWALSTNQDPRKELAIELAEFLTENNFLASWNQAAGYLPPRPSSVRTWTNDELKIITSQIANSATLMPSSDIVTSLGGPLQQATVQVLKKQEEPLSAAQNAAASLTAP
jgi:ABC-type glycerol-3-phosphate transport system substrate-binding protein